MSLITLLSEALNSKIEELHALRMKQQERILNSFSENNNGLEPTQDYNGRLHAPCDGYAHFETGELYGKGQFIVMPEYDDWYSPASYPARSYDPNTRFKGPTADFQETIKLMESFKLRVKTGRRWQEDGKEFCYFTVTGHKPLIDTIKKTADAFQAEQREHEKQFKGAAPNGKATEEATILSVKYVPSNFGYNRVDTKMIVKLSNGATAYGTMPKNLIEKGAKAGDALILCATFKQDDKDNTHAFFTRPTILEPEAKA